MNIVCYPHYAAGGLICNILNQPPVTGSHISSTVKSLEHFLFIGDNDDIYDDFDSNVFEQKRIEAQTLYPPNKPWLGTHCHPIGIDLSNFKLSISITTNSFESKLYRWLRAYNLFFKPQWEHYTGVERIDLMRETAKSYLKPFYSIDVPKLIQIEFCDIVNLTPKFKVMCQSLTNNTDFSKVDTWLVNNSFLKSYTNLPEYYSFLQADYELSTRTQYTYE